LKFRFKHLNSEVAAMTLFSWMPGNAGAIAVLAGSSLFGAERIVILEERMAELPTEPVATAGVREIGRITGAVRLAIPEAGGHLLVLTREGKVWAWGDNSHGQLGTGGTQPVKGWARVERLGKAVAVAAGAEHSMALLEDGTVWTWGGNAMGQLGDGTLMGHQKPRPVEGLTGVAWIAAGTLESAALKADGSVWVFGSNWREIARGEPQRMLTKPVRVRGPRLNGEIRIAGGEVVQSLPALRREWLEQARSASAGLTADNVVDVRRGWRLGWIELTPEDGGIEETSQVARRPAAEVMTSIPDRSGESRGAAQPLAIVNTAKAAAGFLRSLAVASDGTVWTWGNVATFSQGAAEPVAGVSGAVAVAAGTDHSLALRVDGTVWAWGVNNYGQLGVGDTGVYTMPQMVKGLTNITAISSRAHFSLALKGDGTVWAWGLNTYGQLGDGTTAIQATPIQVSGLTGVVGIAAGTDHSLALKADGSVWGWGTRQFGVLGVLPGTGPVLAPVQVNGLTGMIALSAGVTHNLALKSDHTVWAWGTGDMGQLGLGALTITYVPAQIGGLTDVTAISAGYHHSLALRSDGTVRAWGGNLSGSLGDGTTLPRNTPVQVQAASGIAAVAAGYDHSLAVKNDGTLWAWGSNSFRQLGIGTPTYRSVASEIAGSTGMLAVAAHSAHSLAVRSDGTAWAWGFNGYGQLGDGTTTPRSTPGQVSGLTGVTAVSTGHAHSLALRNDGSVWAWGTNFIGQLGDGTVLPRYTPGQVPALAGVVAIATGFHHNLAVRDDGTVWSWGSNFYGELGDGSTNARGTPAQVLGLTGVVSVAAGYGHSLALKSDGTVWAWGSNDFGQLGDGTGVDQKQPVRVTALTYVSAVAAGQYHSLAVKKDGTVWAWGANWNGQLGDGTTLERGSPVRALGLTGVAGAAGQYGHSLARKGDGSAWAWGVNRHGQVGDGTSAERHTAVRVAGLSGVVSLAAGEGHSLAVTQDGKLWSWGQNDYGQVGYGQPAYHPAPVMAIPLGAPDLSITMSHGGSFAIGGQATYWITIWNISQTATSGGITVTDTLPGGMTFVSAAGQGWNCSFSSPAVTCTHAGPVNPGGSTTITLNANAGWGAHPAVTNIATVSNASDANLSNNTTGDPAEVTAPPGLRYVAVTPCRVADTRNPAGPFGGPAMTGNTSRSFAIPQSACGIADEARAYSLNVTVVPRGPLSWLTLWPTGQAQPWVSTLNSYSGDVASNAAIVPAGSGGAVSVYVTNDTDVILDINGYFDGSAASAFYADAPCRVVDTRWTAGPFGGPGMSAGQTRPFALPAGNCGIPSNAAAYSTNYTVVPAGYLGYLSTWPAGQSRPVVSTLNSWKGKVVAGAAIVPAGAGGAVNVFVTDPTQLILDINGHFGAPGGNGSLSFYPVAPCRMADTRGAAGPFGGPILAGGSTRSFAAPQSACGIPAAAKAYSVNVTVVPSGPLTYLTAWPAGTAQPVVSTLNSWDGAVVANAAIVPAGMNGAISFFVTDSTHLVLDINGYFQ
jgi:uncharacterized repeat protein (TIGR01451 family)